MSNPTDEVMRTADGVPLKISLQKALVRSRLRALLLVLPLLAYVLVFFLFPIGHMLFRSVDNRLVASVLPRTAASIQDWEPDRAGLPGEAVFEALVRDVQTAFNDKTLGRIGRRLNYEKPGMSSLFRRSGRRAPRITGPPLQGSTGSDRQTLGETSAPGD